MPSRLSIVRHDGLIKILALLVLLFLGNINAQEIRLSPNEAGPRGWLDTCSEWDDWDKPAPPFHVFGNTYFVGTCGISAILITGDQGHILIDGGTEVGAKVIANNIESLGISIQDVKLLLHSHEHFDHVAGLAELKKRSGAKLFASSNAAPVLSTGITAEIDPQAGMHKPFPAVRVDRILEKQEVIRLGELKIKGISTPGHSPGAMSWQWESCDKTDCVSIVYADSLSAVSHDHYRFSDNPQYVAAFKQSLNELADLSCDILLAPHPSASKMLSRLADSDGLIDPNACRAYAESALKRLNKRLHSETIKANERQAVGSN